MLRELLAGDGAHGRTFRNARGGMEGLLTGFALNAVGTILTDGSASMVLSALGVEESLNWQHR